MNKQKMKNLFKIGILIFGISFLLTNCEKNNVSEKEILEVAPELEEHGISITLTSFSQPEEKLSGLRNKYHIDSHIGIKQSAKTQSKSSNGKSDIIVYTDIVKKITQGDYTSYTMLIESLDDDPNTFYNITIEEKNDTTGMFVTQYKSIPQNKSAKSTLSKSSGTSETQISTKTITTIQEPLGKEDFGNEEGGSSGGGSGGGGSSSTYPTDCDGLVNTTTVAVETPCGCGHSWNQLLNGTCIGCSTGYPTWPSLETNTIYECIPSSIGNPTTGGGTDTGGGVSVPPNDISDDSITTPVNPDGTSAVPDILTNYLSLSATQTNLLILFPDLADDVFKFLQQNNTVEAKDLFPNSLYNGKGDAFRHAYWNALNVILLGDTLTASLTTAHENKPSSYSNDYKEKQMDLFNNEVGRTKSNWLSDGYNSLIESILHSISNGELRYLSNLLGGGSSGRATSSSQLIPTN